jgi:hypothetical protein
LRSELLYGALLAYSPRGQSEISRGSRDVCYQIKAGNLATLQHAAQRLREHIATGGVLAPLFESEVVLVPMPRSAPLVAGALWPAEKICQAMVHAGLAVATAPALERHIAVPKSSRAQPGERPPVSQHYDSFRAQLRTDITDRILIVDDVVTKGSTALAAASRLAEAYPRADIRLFAVIRTKGMVPDIDQILDPVSGMIQLHGDECDRQP